MDKWDEKAFEIVEKITPRGGCARPWVNDLIAAALRSAAQEKPDPERVAQLIAHRACCGNEHDGISKFHGYCVVCGVVWPCEYAGVPPVAAQEDGLREVFNKAAWAYFDCETDADPKGLEPEGQKKNRKLFVAAWDAFLAHQSKKKGDA